MEYRDVKGYEGLYKVSEYGEIIRLPKKVNSARSSSGYRVLSERKLSINLDRQGYPYLCLVGHDGIRKHCKVHRLVAMAFIDNPDNHPVINHIDENKSNNHYTNLEWCTIRHNNLYKGRQEKINEKLKEVSPNKKSLVQLSLDDDIIAEYSSINEACRETGLYKSGISRCCNNKWKFK